MAVGRVWYGAKYSYGVWERFAHQGNTLPKTQLFDMCSTIYPCFHPLYPKYCNVASWVALPNFVRYQIDTELSKRTFLPNVQHKCRKCDFSEMCSPGGQIVATPRRSILHHTKPSQLPYNEKSNYSAIFDISYIFPIYFLISFMSVGKFPGSQT